MWVAAAMLGTIGSHAHAQAQNPEQMKRMYDDAVAQLKAAQDRKNELAAENERLQQQLAAAQKDLAAANARLDELKRSDADHAEKTFFLRSHYLAWQLFVKEQPELNAKWKAFIKSDYYAAPLAATAIRDPYFPFGLPVPVNAPDLQPATNPTTAPAAPSTAPIPSTTPIPATAPASSQPASAPPAVPATGPAVTAPATVPASGAETGPTTRPN
jgi:hypothetical protein